MTERKKLKRDPNIARRKITIDRPALEIDEVDRLARLAGYKRTPEFFLACVKAARVDLDLYLSLRSEPLIGM